MKDFSSLRIVFMGTPEFAVSSLDALVNAGCKIVGVITSPDKPGGRGMQLQQSAVKKYAHEHQLKILQPEKLKNPDFLSELRSLNADLQVVVAFRMLPEAVWNMPPMGTINLHGSLLPQYRGAAPINWAIINGEKTTGVTTFKLKHEIDTGDILLQESFPIDENETAGEIHDRLKLIGAALLVKTVKGLADDAIQDIPQSAISNQTVVPVNPAPKIYTEHCKIDFAKTTEQVHNLIRGLSPNPGAFTYLNGKMLKIYRAEKIMDMILPSAIMVIDHYITNNRTYLYLACADGFIKILELQLEGKKKMNTGDFLRGYRFEK